MDNKILVICTTDSMIWNFLVPHIQRLQQEGYIIECACSRTGEYFTWLQEKYGFVMHQIQFERNPFRIANIKAYRQLKKLIKAQAYEIVFCHEPVGGAMGRIVGSRFGCTIIYMAHGFHFYKGCPKSNYLYYFVERSLARKTDYLLTLNNEDYEASQRFKARHKIKISGIGIDVSKFKPENYTSLLRHELNLDQNAFILLSVGELIQRKNHESMIKALTTIPDQVCYVIAGDGELWDYLNQLVSTLGLEKRVFLLGYRRDIKNLCNSCDVFVLPSYQEGLSVALMEAMACGKPVIASEIRGNTDLIDNNIGGILVKANDISGYAKAINRLFDNTTLQKQYGEYNMKKVRDFSLDNVENQIISVFKMIKEGR